MKNHEKLYFPLSNDTTPLLPINNFRQPSCSDICLADIVKNFSNQSIIAHFTRISVHYPDWRGCASAVQEQVSNPMPKFLVYLEDLVWFVWCLTARQHRICQFVPTAGGWNRLSWLRMADETQCIIHNTLHNVTQFTIKHSSYKNATTGYLIDDLIA